MSSNYDRSEILPVAAIATLFVIFGFTVGIGFEMTEDVLQLFWIGVALCTVYLLYRIAVAVEHIASDS